MDTIETGNVLIAEFMGAKPDGGSTAADDGTMARSYELEFGEVDICYYDKQTVNKYTTDIRSLRFDSSWSWIMPVVAKIEAMKHDPKEMFMGTTLERKLKFENVTMLPMYSSITSVWKQVVQFIKWYNNQNSKP